MLKFANMLQRRLYDILFQNGNTFRVSLISECDIFKAHFVDNPILPGVCTAQIVCELASKFIDKSLELIEVTNIKFLKTVSPNEHPELDFTFVSVSQTDNDELKVRGTVADGTEVFSKFSFVFKIV